MAWTIEYDPLVKVELKRLDKATAKRIVEFLEGRVTLRDDPRTIGAALSGSVWGSLWKYRIGDYRVIADIQDERLTILAVQIGHHRDVYKNRK